MPELALRASEGAAQEPFGDLRGGLRAMIESDLQSLSPGAIIMLFELGTAGAGEADVFRFHPGVNGLSGDVVFNGHAYTRFPVEASGFEKRSSGTLPRPKVKLANVTGLAGALARELNDPGGREADRDPHLRQVPGRGEFPRRREPRRRPGAGD
jgi:hypothetical protein